MPVEPIGLSIGVVGILLAFKGVVDTVNLFDLIVSRDNGSRHLALKYEIERRKTVLWGDEHRAEDEDNSPLLRESKSTRTLIAGILAELRAAHELAAKYVDHYDMEQVTAAGAVTDGSMAIGGHAVMSMKVLRDTRLQKSRFLWGTSHKAKFTEIVSRMESLNGDLYSLVRSDNTEVLANALSSYLLPKLQNSLSLVALQQSDTTLDPLLVLSARIKQLQIEPLDQIAKQTKMLAIGADFFPDEPLSTGRTFGFTKADNETKVSRPSWAEWKTVKTDDANAKEITMRVKALATILAAPKPKEFRIPPCSGLLSLNTATGTGTIPAHKFGFAYEWPDHAYDSTIKPKTLLDLITSEDFDMPLLDDRFALAYSIASAISMFHATGWIHKAFRSDNILFFFKNGTCCISSPYITGFEYARPEKQASLEVRPTGQPNLDLYYRPDVMVKGFSRVQDIYSLGIVLFEIARWASLSADIPTATGRTLEEMKPEEIRREIETSIPALGAQMGSSYRDAVAACIKGDFGAAADQDDGEALARIFFASVLKRLAYSRV